MEADCGDYLKSFDNIIEGEMGFVFSSWDNSAGKEDFECEGLCPEPAATCENAVNTIANFKVNQWNSNENRPDDNTDPERIDGGVAANISMCEEGCSACHKTWMSNTPDVIEYMCYDETVYQYRNKCGNKRDLSLCGEEDICHISWPHGDTQKARSPDAACRPVPDEYIFNDFMFATKRECKNMNQGLCRYGCDEGETCRNSWWAEDALRWKSASAMCRCAPVA